MTPLELLVVGGGGALIGHLWTKRMFHRHLDGPIFQREVRKQLDIAFRSGMLVVADILTMEGQEEAAGKIRMAARELEVAVEPANNNT